MTEEERIRYSRNMLLANVGEAGQQHLMDARVLIVGAGGLGSPVSLYLAAAGIGTIGIIDGDNVDLTNLQRQVIHFSKDVETPKVESAKKKVLELNPNIKVEAIKGLFDLSNAKELVSRYDFIVDATDNFDAKFLINDTCVELGKPFVHGSLLRWEGNAFTYVPGSACYRCIYPTPPEEGTVPSSSQAGVIGAIAGMVGTAQAAEVVKYFTGAGELLTNQLLHFDALTMTFTKIKIKKRDKCSVCKGR